MSLSRRLTRSPEDVLVEELRRLKDRVRRLENQHSPTVPIYQPDFPDDAVDGQFALSTVEPENFDETSEALPYFFWDEEWHPLRGEQMLPYAWAISSEFTMGTDAPDDYTLVWGENPFQPTPLDTDIFRIHTTSTEDPFGIYLKKPGLYWIRASLTWDSSFGPVDVGIIPPSPGVTVPGFSMPNTPMNKWLIKPASAVEASIEITDDTFLAFGQPPDPEDGAGIGINIFNNDPTYGADRADRILYLAVIRLSPAPDPDQSPFVLPP